MQTAPVDSISSHRISTVLGAALGVPLGLAFIALLFFLRQYLKTKALSAPTAKSDIFFPPDPIYNPATKVLPRAELDAQSKVIHELDGQVAPSELESIARAAVHPRDPSTPVCELDATSPDPNNRISTMTHLSPVSSFALSPQHDPTATGVARTCA